MADPRKVPIDIAYRKLLEALVDRKIVLPKWADQHQQIRDGLAILYPELPTSSDALLKFQAKTPTHDDLTYFDCKALLSLLQSSPEGASTNFFGQYTSPVIKKWTALVKLYEKNNVFAAEAARVVTQNTAFEIPFLKKTMQQNDKHVADNKRKMVDLNKSIAESKRKLENACSEMGIAGVVIRDELQRLPMQLPSLFAQVATTICTDEVAAAMAYHEALQTYLHACEVPVTATLAVPAEPASSKKDQQKKKKKNAKASATASEVLVVVEDDHDDSVTPFAFFTAIKSLRDASDVAADEPSAVSVDLDAADVMEIDWDISMESGGDVTIDWGIEEAAAGATTTTATSRSSSDESGVHVDMGGECDDEMAAAVVEIDWDITSEEIGGSVDVDAKHEEQTVEIDLATVDGSPFMPFSLNSLSASGSSPLTRVGLLSDNDFRARVLNDLLELKAFLRHRRDEFADQSSTTVAFANQLQGSSALLLEHQSDDKLKKYQQAVDDAIDQLTQKKLQQLVLIKTSDRFLDRQVARLEMLTKHMDKCEREIKQLEDKNLDLVDATVRLQPQIDALVKTTKMVKRELMASSATSSDAAAVAATNDEVLTPADPLVASGSVVVFDMPTLRSPHVDAAGKLSGGSSTMIVAGPAGSVASGVIVIAVAAAADPLAASSTSGWISVVICSPGPLTAAPAPTPLSGNCSGIIGGPAFPGQPMPAGGSASCGRGFHPRGPFPPAFWSPRAWKRNASAGATNIEDNTASVAAQVAVTATTNFMMRKWRRMEEVKEEVEVKLDLLDAEAIVE